MGRRLTLFAGAGDLATEVCAAALAEGYEVQVLAFTPREAIAGVRFRAADVSRPLRVLLATRLFRTDFIVMAGAIQLGDRARTGLGRFLGGRRDARAAQPAGDTALSGLARTLKRLTGAEVVGAHTIAPGLLAGEGVIGGAPTSEDGAFALATARAVGQLDIGQAAVTCGRRVVAVEDIGGTDDLIARVGVLKARGATGDGAAPLILAKARKPGQPDYVDLPAIGPQTVRGAAAVGISVVAVEAGQALIIDRPGVVAEADRLGVTVLGVALQ